MTPTAASPENREADAKTEEQVGSGGVAEFGDTLLVAPDALVVARHQRHEEAVDGLDRLPTGGPREKGAGDRMGAG